MLICLTIVASHMSMKRPRPQALLPPLYCLCLVLKQSKYETKRQLEKREITRLKSEKQLRNRKAASAAANKTIAMKMLLFFLLLKQIRKMHIKLQQQQQHQR